MPDHKPGENNLGAELKELGRQLTEAVKAVATSDEVRSMGNELRDGFREAAHTVEETLSKVRERDEVQRLRERAANVADAFRTGEAQREIRTEVAEALHALNTRLRDLLSRFESSDASQGTTPDASTSSSEDTGYTGTTRRLDS